MKKYKVSVILPIYNVENYLKKCVDSIVRQTYGNLEIILVDDGSKDSCPDICDSLLESDNRIKVIHKENGGLSSARNAGYKEATGDFLMYIDSDDSIKNDIVERCISAIEKDNSDIVIYGYEKTDENGNIFEVCKWGNKTLNNREMVEYLYEGITQMSFGYAWNKLYRKSMLDKSQVLADSKIIDREDLIYNLELMPYVNKVTYIDYAGYEYLQRGNSLLHNSNLARLSGIQYFVKRMKEIDTGNEQVNRKIFNMNVLHYLSDCIIKNVLWNEELYSKEKKEIMRDIIEKCPYKDMLYNEKEDSAYLKALYKTIRTGNPNCFYRYVKLSDLKRKLLR